MEGVMMMSKFCCDCGKEADAEDDVCVCGCSCFEEADDEQGVDE